jgi:hypothetical protein
MLTSRTTRPSPVYLNRYWSGMQMLRTRISKCQWQWSVSKAGKQAGLPQIEPTIHLRLALHSSTVLARRSNCRITSRNTMECHLVQVYVISALVHRRRKHIKLPPEQHSGFNRKETSTQKVLARVYPTSITPSLLHTLRDGCREISDFT